MTSDGSERQTAPPRKPLWPWLVLLVLTLCAIYSYHRLSALADDIMRDMPQAIIELFDDLIGPTSPRPPAGPGADRAGQAI